MFCLYLLSVELVNRIHSALTYKERLPDGISHVTSLDDIAEGDTVFSICPTGITLYRGVYFEKIHRDIDRDPLYERKHYAQAVKGRVVCEGEYAMEVFDDPKSGQNKYFWQISDALIRRGGVYKFT